MKARDNPGRVDKAAWRDGEAGGKAIMDQRGPNEAAGGPMMQQGGMARRLGFFFFGERWCSG